MKKTIYVHVFLALLLFCGCSENSASTSNIASDSGNTNYSSDVIDDFICQDGQIRTFKFDGSNDEFASNICRNGQWVCNEGDLSSTGQHVCFGSQWIVNALEKKCNHGDLFTDGIFNYVCVDNEWVLYALVESSSSSENLLTNQYVSSSSAGSVLVNGILTDYRDGLSYRVVNIGSQIWMAENLNYKSWCATVVTDECLTHVPKQTYYWEEAMNACPSGWHLPSNAEWYTLFLSVGGQFTAGKALKSNWGWTGDRDWIGGDVYGTDAYGFSARSSGYWISYNYHNEGDYAFFWSSTEGFSMELVDRSDIAYLIEGRKYRSSVRCVKDGSAVNPLANVDPVGPIMGTLIDKRDGQTYKTVSLSYQMIQKTWMAQNLNYKTDSSFCYNNDEKYCNKVGRLYIWDAAMNACPAGWQLPSIQRYCCSQWYITIYCDNHRPRLRQRARLLLYPTF